MAPGVIIPAGRLMATSDALRGLRRDGLAGPKLSHKILEALRRSACVNHTVAVCADDREIGDRRGGDWARSGQLGKWHFVVSDNELPAKLAICVLKSKATDLAYISVVLLCLGGEPALALDAAMLNAPPRFQELIRGR